MNAFANRPFHVQCIINVDSAPPNGHGSSEIDVCVWFTCREYLGLGRTGRTSTARPSRNFLGSGICTTFGGSRPPPGPTSSSRRGSALTPDVLVLALVSLYTSLILLPRKAHRLSTRPEHRSRTRCTWPGCWTRGKFFGRGLPVCKPTGRRRVGTLLRLPLPTWLCLVLRRARGSALALSTAAPFSLWRRGSRSRRMT